MTRHTFKSQYPSWQRELAQEAIILERERWLITALNAFFGHDKWSLNDVRGQARHEYPLGEEGPTLVVFRGEPLLKFYPPEVSRVLSRKGEISYSIDYEYLGRASEAQVEVVH